MGNLHIASHCLTVLTTSLLAVMPIALLIRPVSNAIRHPATVQEGRLSLGMDITVHCADEVNT